MPDNDFTAQVHPKGINAYGDKKEVDALTGELSTMKRENPELYGKVMTRIDQNYGALKNGGMTDFKASEIQEIVEAVKYRENFRNAAAKDGVISEQDKAFDKKITDLGKDGLSKEDMAELLKYAKGLGKEHEDIAKGLSGKLTPGTAQSAEAVASIDNSKGGGRF